MIEHPHRTPTFTPPVPPEPVRYIYRLVRRDKDVPEGILVLLVVWVLALIGLSVAIVCVGFNPPVIRAICILAAWGLAIAACYLRVERVPK